MSEPTLYRKRCEEPSFSHPHACSEMVPVELLTADEQATIMYACQHSDAGRLTRPEEVKLVSLIRTLVERIGGSDGE